MHNSQVMFMPHSKLEHCENYIFNPCSVNSWRFYMFSSWKWILFAQKLTTTKRQKRIMQKETQRGEKGWARKREREKIGVGRLTVLLQFQVLYIAIASRALARKLSTCENEKMCGFPIGTNLTIYEYAINCLPSNADCHFPSFKF